MNLYISASNRKQNSYQFLKDLKMPKDELLSLADLRIEYCLGCSSCIEKLPHYCVLQDDMKVIYEKMLQADKIIIMSPIYMNQITGILKNMIDRLNPFSCHELLRNKKIFLITVGAMDEEENKEVTQDIKKYFEGISEFFYFDFIYLKNLSSGDIQTIDNIKDVYQEDYNKVLEVLRKQIEK